MILRSVVRTFAAGVVLALACFALSPSGAFAAKEKKAFLVLRMEGEGIDADTLAKLDAAARKQTAESTKPSKLLPPPALDFESMRVAAGCSDDNARCVASIGETLAATNVVRVRVAKVGDVGAKFNITVVRVKDAKTGASTLEVPALDNIAIEELRNAIAALFGDKRPPAPKRPDAPGGIALLPANSEVDLDDVEIFLDDKKFPLTALRNLPLGQHQLEVHKPGHEPFIWSGAVRAGQQTKVSVELRPIAGKIETPVEIAKTVETPVIKDPPPKKDEIAMVEPAKKDPMLQATAAETNVAPEEPKLFYTWMLAGGAVAMSAVGVGGWAYLNTINSRLVDSCGGEDKVMLDEEGNMRCFGEQTFTGCPLEGDQPERCQNGKIAATMTWVGFVGGAVLGAAAIGMFFAEDGPAMFSSEPEVGAMIIPLGDGVAASFTARY